MSSPVKYWSVLGTPIAGVDDAGALEACARLARSGRPCAVSPGSVRTVLQARLDPAFRHAMERFDLVLPGGMPLVWVLNRRGARLRDRLYGPYFMRHVLEHAEPGTRHFFFGGTGETLAEWTESVRKSNPGAVIAGVCSPPLREWTEEDEEGFARQIRESGADYIWVAPGRVGPERWIAANLHRHSRGVFSAVGDVPGTSRPRAALPAWLLQVLRDPVRRGWGPLRDALLFLYYLVRDGLMGREGDGARVRGDGGRGFKVGFVGSRGVPARYSGFETVVEELGSRLASRGHEVTVYNRQVPGRKIRGCWKGMRLLWLPTIPTKNLESIVHTSLSLVDAMFRGYDILYVCGVGNTPWSGILARLAGRRMVVNVDGADFKRKKWGRFARWWLQKSEQRAIRLADAVVADNRAAVERYRVDYGFEPHHLTYGAPLRPDRVRSGELERWGLEPGGYILHVSRLTPENETDLVLRAHARMQRRPPLVIVGSAGYEGDYEKYLHTLASDNVVFTGGKFGDAYVELSQQAAFFVMPATIEATRLVLLDQMGMGKAVLYHDCPASREVLGDAAIPFRSEGEDAGDLVDILADKMTALYADKAQCAACGERAWERARTVYSWDRMVDRYEELFAKLCGCKSGLCRS